ncbi:hypothetical protein E1956_36315 [Paraburkholderia pallida]|uniref:Uncharacterized protein n=1 Tax=Paraburkholderia pallida TaxID=2547399 RepID=A0A4P7D3X7_9BURK|nr:hypothetical protein E1956_36315 [Paraburkholderia pallida]
MVWSGLRFGWGAGVTRRWVAAAPTFFAAAKKVGAAPHRGNACGPPRNQVKAKTEKHPKRI